MSGPGDNGDGDGDQPGAGKWPPDAEYAVPTGAKDTYDPSYVPPPADPARDDQHAVEGPPGGLYAGPDVSTGGGAAAPPAPAGPFVPGEEPLLPPELATEGALHDAIGAPSAKARRRARTQPRGDGDDDDLAPPRSRRTMIIATTSIIVGLAIATLVFLGHANAQRYALACDATHAIPEQGRSFPPWGTRPMHGAEWAPITLPPNAECQPRETDDAGELGKWYLGLLIDRATATLTARDLLDTVGNQSAANPLDAVAAQLDQALLLARDPDRRDQRKEIARLQGDVEYWRAAARLRDASAILLDAAKQFDTANQHHPRHATDAAAWSTFLHRLSDELRAGPSGMPSPNAVVAPTTAAAAESPPVPVGTALPVEPEGSGAGSALPPPTPDAGVPSGGVLL